MRKVGLRRDDYQALLLDVKVRWSGFEPGLHLCKWNRIKSFHGISAKNELPLFLQGYMSVECLHYHIEDATTLYRVPVFFRLNHCLRRGGKGGSKEIMKEK